MKIEIGENLVASYLKHVEGCRIIQTNWKTSNQWETTEYEKKQARNLFDRIKKSEHFSEIFKDSTFEQAIKQAEIDVLGINSVEKSIFGIDVAFHSSGLNYGSKEETSLRLFKKIFRTIMIMQMFFSDQDKIYSLFITPKTNNATESIIRELIVEANKLINDEMIIIDFISNEEFFEKIVDPMLLNIDQDNDTSELFIRSIKLMQLDKRLKINADETTTKTRTEAVKTEYDGMKIGQFIQNKMRSLYERRLLTDLELLNLQDREYSKKVFDQNYEILRSLDKDITSSDGRNRYYTKEKFFGNFYLNSQWTERHWKPLLNWLDKFNLN